MGKTLAEKILAACCGQEQVSAGEIITAHVDCAMLDDGLGPWFMDNEFKELGSKIAEKENVVVISDHMYPSGTTEQAEIVKYTRDWAKAQNVTYFEGNGPCHQTLAEYGYDIPGTLLVGTDSHTCTAGAFGCFGTGIGSTEMAAVLPYGEIWLRVPESMAIEWEGPLTEGVMAKDLILKTIGDIGNSGATYMAMEFRGSTIENLPMDERLCICNMAVEAGAKTGLIAADEVTDAYLKTHGINTEYRAFRSDEDAVYVHTHKYRAAELVPMVACPHAVDNVHPVTEQSDVEIHQAYIGSCTGGRLNDLRMAAKVLKGRKIHENCRLLVSPGSKAIYKQALAEGLLDIFIDAGGVVLAPTCGACVGLHSGLIAKGENCVTATNRNFKGRMGSYDSNLYLASPATVAASAIAGHLDDPRKYFKGEK